MLLHSCIRDVASEYEGLVVGDGAGCVLWRRNRVANLVTVAKYSGKIVEGTANAAEYMISVFKATMLANDHNEEAYRRQLEIEVALLTRIGGAHAYCEWPNRLIYSLKDLVLKKHVRVLVGFFDCEHRQLATVLRHCGASGGQVISQPFVSNGPAVAGQGKVLTHPHYAVVFGPADIRADNPEDQPCCPAWLNIANSDLARFTLDWAERPRWWNIQWGPLWNKTWAQPWIQRLIGCEHYWDFKDWPHLNKVVTKVTNLTKWQGGVHQLGLWIEGRGKKAEWGRANGKY